MNKGIFTRFDLKQRLVAASRKGAVVGLSVMGTAAMAADDPAGILTSITSLQTTTIGYVTAGITACVAVMLVALSGDIGIGVAKKWLRKGAS